MAIKFITIVLDWHYLTELTDTPIDFLQQAVYGTGIQNIHLIVCSYLAYAEC